MIRKSVLGTVAKLISDNLKTGELWPQTGESTFGERVFEENSYFKSVI
jgi:hypothetical protein